MIEDMQLPVTLGVYAHELKLPRTVSVDLSFDYAIGAFPVEDHISQAVDYEEIEKSFQEIAAECSYNLIETLAERLLRKTLENLKIQSASVTVKKRGALGSAGIVAVSVSGKRE